MDAKGRLALPSLFQHDLKDGAFMTQGLDRNLQVLTTNAFEQVCRRMSSLNLTDPLARLLLRTFLGTAVEVPRAKLTTVQIPDALQQFANLQHDVVLVGQGDYFEIWATDLWNQQEAQLADAEANSARFSGLTITTR
jgi:MraZ protein